MITPAATDRITRALYVCAGLVALLGAIGLVFGLGAGNTSELRHALGWYLGERLAEVVVVPLAVLSVGALIVATVARRRANSQYAQRAAKGAIPARESAAVADEALVREAHAVLQEALRGARPRVERVIDTLLCLPVDLGAGGLALDPHPGEVQISLQVAMTRLAVGRMPPALYRDVLAQLRTMASIDGEVGQGRLDLCSGEAVEQIRVVLRAAAGGISARIQVLSNAGFALALEELELPEPLLHRLAAAIEQPHALVLLNAPTGQGLTTTLYALAHYANRRIEQPGLIASLEDPVRQDLPFVNQIEVGDGRPAALLEGLLERDCRVLLVRQVEDRHAMRMALAAASERLVIICTTAPTVVDAIRELASIGSAGQIDATFSLGLGQRLLRRVCPACTVERTLSDEAHQHLTALGLEPPPVLFRGAGCDQCGGQGYVGQVPVYEVVHSGRELRARLTAGGDDQAWHSLYEATGNIDLLAAGLQRAAAGLTTASEVIRLGQTLARQRTTAGERRR